MSKDPYGLFDPRRPTSILLMRHPQSKGNRSKRYMGQQNAYLSKLGWQQCVRAIDGLVNWQPTAVVTSPLSRCLAVAMPTAAYLGLELEVDDRLMEMNFGVLEGCTHQEALDRGLAFPWDPSSGTWPVSGAESIEDFTERLQAVAADLTARRGRIAVITHGGVLRMLTSFWLHMPSEYSWAMTIRNVESACFSLDKAGTVYLDAFGLQPEWLSGPPA
ncbi:MAG: histidine phosphatase family protein, partial [Actinomycetia bacterium]|nr:histidine phosphatase family protein [Actinomycetes bacterium]